MAEFPPDKPVKAVKDDEEEERADHALTTEEEEVQAEEDKPKEETIFRLLNPATFALKINLEDEESSDKGNQSLQAESNTIPRADQTMTRGSTSFLSHQNRLHRSDTRRSQEMVPPDENVRLGASLVTRPLYQNQTTLIDQTMNQPQGFTLPNRGIGPNSAPSRPQSIRTGSAFIGRPYAQWRYQNTFHNYAPWSHHQQPRMVIMRMPNQNIVPRPAFVVDQNVFNQSFDMQLQQQIVPNVGLIRAPMMPMMQHEQIIPNLVPIQPLMRPMIQQDQVFPNIVPGQAPMRPVMYNQAQIVPNVVPYQAAMWPMMYNQQQQFNNQQHFGFPIYMIHQASPTVAAGLPRPELNHQQMQQLQPHREQPTQSQGFNSGPSSDQSQGSSTTS